MIERESEMLEFWYEPETLESFINKLKALSNTVPDDAKLHAWVGGYDMDEVKMVFNWYSEETDEEYATRLDKEFWEKKRIEDDEKAIYLKLKNKFEEN